MGEVRGFSKGCMDNIFELMARDFGTQKLRHVLIGQCLKHHE